MGVDFFVPEVQSQTTSVASMCTDYISNMESIKAALGTFVSDTELKGAAYSSAKNYFSQVYTPLANGIILVCESIKSAHEKFINQYLSDVDGNSLQSEILEQQIRTAQSTIDTMTTELLNISKNPESYRPGLSHSIDINQRMQKSLQEKLNKLLAFDGSSTTIFSEVNSALSNVQQGLAQASSGNGWDATTGTFTTAKLNMDWANSITIAYADRVERQLTELLADYPNLSQDAIEKIMQIMNQNQGMNVPESVSDKIVSFFSNIGDGIGQAYTYITKEIKFSDILLSAAESFGGAVFNYYLGQGIAGPAGANSFIMLSEAAANGSRWGANFAKNASRASLVLAGLATVYGIYDDVKNNGKTVGQGISHNVTGTVLTVGGSMLVGALVSSNPIGWGFAAGVAIGAGFNWAYDNNFLGLQDGLDWVGNKIDAGLNWAGDKISDGLDWAGDKLNDFGDSVSGALDWINPF
ncbi:T7SS effector LXG polymorphic toxin [Enterococcus wangshanyuanii]|uniref:LXG domain-containing protein n=1 Tax=Enterococcus wangshanyuanii TaxID=2005703 RepID=A0ABQ1PFY4_9ENTE|nr:T7SS effector LXG polymorphic toxin [Enterococcus wangshanyuanii]GGC96378.1 hypothetical protein GCM10011573_27480 [Enterococcus wangshanyuanii]